MFKKNELAVVDIPTNPFWNRTIVKIIDCCIDIDIDHVGRDYTKVVYTIEVIQNNGFGSSLTRPIENGDQTRLRAQQLVKIST